MDQEVARTLAQLEQKLRELETELVSLGRQSVEGAEPAAPGPTHTFASPTHEPLPTPAQPPTSPPAPTRAPAPSHPYAAANPPMPPGEQQPPAAPEQRSLGRLVDEALEPPPGPVSRYSMEAQETAFGEIPATRDEQHSIELVELVRFRERMQRTLQELIDEYSRLLSLGPRR